MAALTDEQMAFVTAVQKFIHSSQKAISKLTADLIQLADRVDTLEATAATLVELSENRQTGMGPHGYANDPIA